MTTEAVAPSATALPTLVAMLRMIEAVMPSATAFPGEPGIDLTTEDVDPSATALPGVADMVTPLAASPTHQMSVIRT